MTDADEVTRQYEDAFQVLVATEQWRQAVEARTEAADWAWETGRRGTCLAYLDEAISLADQHGLTSLAGQLRLKKLDLRVDADVSGATLDAADLKKELGRILASSVSTLMLIAKRSSAIGDRDTAGEALEAAAALAQKLPEQERWLINLEQARYFASAGDLSAALRHAQAALRFVRRLGSPLLAAQALSELVPLRAELDDPAEQQAADQELAELERSGQAQELALALISRAQVRYRQRRFSESREDLDRALASTRNGDLRLRALGQKMLALEALDDDSQALGCALDAMTILQQNEQDDRVGTEANWRDRLQDAEGLYAAAAWFEAKAGRARAAFDLAEAGRALRLRRALQRAKVQTESDPAAAGTAATVAGPPTFDEVRRGLAEDSAALVLISILKWGTLVLLADFAHSEPSVFVLDLSGADVRRLLSPADSDYKLGTQAWSEALFATLPELSHKLLAPLEDALRALAPQCRTIYIAPDTHLYRLPFAALTFADGTFLAQACPLALTPSAAALAACRTRRFRAPGRSLLAYGVGAATTQDNRSVYFGNESRTVASFAWQEAVRLPENTPCRDLLSAFPRHTVIHLACHGVASGEIYDTSEASYLELYPPERLTARDVLGGPRLRADLVFLNACQSGNFRMSTRTEADGFWSAFLVAGATSIIATLTMIEPDSAEALALDFYRAWLDGASKAEALRSAQLAAIVRGAKPDHWAAHILIGDAA